MTSKHKLMTSQFKKCLMIKSIDEVTFKMSSTDDVTVEMASMDVFN
jgi:hypothetical protein